jgi:hypothetical protein
MDPGVFSIPVRDERPWNSGCSGFWTVVNAI